MNLKPQEQQWIDHTVSENARSGGVGLCFEGWRYVVKGKLINTSTKINAFIVILLNPQHFIFKVLNFNI